QRQERRARDCHSFQRGKQRPDRPHRAAADRADLDAAPCRRRLLPGLNMAGILYLIPNTLGNAADNDSDPLAHIIPAEVQAITADLGYFVAENAKTTRAFLKLVAANTPLARPLQEIRIA